MSRIDVSKNEDGKYQVLVNLGMTQCNEYSNLTVANSEAQKLHDERYPHYDLNLLQED